MIGLGIAAAITVGWKQPVKWAPEVFEGPLPDATPDPVIRLSPWIVPRLGLLVRARDDGAWAFVLGAGTGSTRASEGRLVAAPPAGAVTFARLAARPLRR